MKLTTVSNGVNHLRYVRYTGFQDCTRQGFNSFTVLHTEAQLSNLLALFELIPGMDSLSGSKSGTPDAAYAGFRTALVGSMAGRYPAHEGLQVALQDHTSQAPEVYQHNAPEVYQYHDSAPETAPQEKPYQYQEPHSPAASKPRRWCGLPKRTALIVAAVVVLVIVGAVIGGIVGALVTRNGNSSASSASSASSTASATATAASDAAVTSAATTASSTSSTSSASSNPTSTSTSTTSAFPTPSNGILPLNCPAINNTQYTTDGASFFIYCLTDFKTSQGNIAQSLQPSINDCIDTCATYNSKNTDEPCQALTFGANLTRYGGANCFLKTGPLQSKPYTVDDYQAGAVLIG
ncbi:hypothetical protein J7T55_002084 [Diaporthe amygdali]|uniref:uncharacterized protein n=1 Tax=Phomopsis amygdali TaxID=1214568 RepID=UPI0022FEFD14|nr:uncharacterized protein J7T55_002084 [Diaporthe amygdali]KAJ0108480.1 hypothetical protein J7T55_002084 [Diaporthe amygdali]